VGELSGPTSFSLSLRVIPVFRSLAWDPGTRYGPSDLTITRPVMSKGSSQPSIAGCQALFLGILELDWQPLCHIREKGATGPRSLRVEVRVACPSPASPP
jgi:hypothetical protein